MIAAVTSLASVEKATHKLTVNGKEVGTLKTEQALLPGGKLRVRDRMELTSPDGVKVVFDFSSRIASTGRPESSVFLAESERGSARIDIAYDAKGANLTIDAGGKKTKKSVPIPKGLTSADPTYFWFIRDKPKVGAKVSCAEFDPMKLE